MGWDAACPRESLATSVCAGPCTSSWVLHAAAAAEQDGLRRGGPGGLTRHDNSRLGPEQTGQNPGLADEALEEATWGFALRSTESSSEEQNQEDSPGPQHRAGYRR